MKFIGILLLAIVATQAAPHAEQDLHSTSIPQQATSVNASEVDHTTLSTKAAGTDEDDDDDVIDNIVSKLDVLLVEVNDDALEKCISNNQTEALAKARGADKEMEKCFSPIIELAESSVAFFEDLDVEVLQNVSQSFCKTYPPLEEKCTAGYYSNLEPCMSASDMKGMKIYDNMTSAALKYLCQYDPSVIIEAAQNGFGCNIYEHIASFIFCIVPPFQEIVHNHHTAMAIPRLLLGKGCRLYKDMARCVHNELRTCKNQTYSDIIVGLFNASAGALPECPSERTEWEQYMGQIVGQLYKEEQAQTDLLKGVKNEIDQLVAINDQQMKFHQDDSDFKQKAEKALTSILEVLNGIKSGNNV